MARLILIAVIATLLVVPAPTSARSPRRRPRQGSATIEGSGDAGISPMELPTALLGLPTAPMSLAKLQQLPQQPANGELPLAAAAAAAPQAKTQIKRIFLQNKCGCKNTASDAPYPIVALSYQPVQAVDFYTVGYWSASCTKTYVIATTNSVVYMSAEMSDGSVTWTGDSSLTVYVPSQNTCEEKRQFKEYKLPQNWNDHTISLTC